MAAYTSTQSGNFNAAATWGGSGYPSANGDTFTVSAGHTVTYNVSSALSTGFGDSNIYGILIHSTGTATEIRMNGRLYIQGGGRYEMVPNSTHIIYGTQGDQHGIWSENANEAHLVTTGSEAMPTTTLSAAVALDGTSFPVTSGSNFAAGEWIAIYREEPSSYEYDNDEGVIIHEVSGNTIYFRQFVGPDANVTSYSGSSLFVDNAKVWRKGQKIIVGTGSNRNIKTISSVNYHKNELVCDSSFSGTIDGLTVYQTGTLRAHDSGETVRKNAAIIASAASSGSSTITLSNAANFDVNDVIIMENGYEASGNNSTYSYDRTFYTITAKSSNTLTLSPSLGGGVGVGDFVTVYSRDCVIKSDDNNTYGYGFVYVEAYTGNYNKILSFKNTEFTKLGNSGSAAFSGLCIRGYGKTSWRTNGFLVSGCTFSASLYHNDRGSLWLYNYGHYSLIRNNVSFNNHSGMNPYYNYNMTFVNNFSLKNSYSNFRIEGAQGYNSIYAFNRGHRSDDYGMWTGVSQYEQGEGIHHNSINIAYRYPALIQSCGNVEAYQNEFLWANYAPHRDWCSSGNFIYCKWTTFRDDGLDGVGFPLGSGYGEVNRGGSDYSFVEFTEHNYEYDKVFHVTYHMLRYWDVEEQAWKIIRRNDSSGNAGFTNLIYVPAGSTISAKFTAKLDPTWNGTQPYGTIRSTTQANGSFTGRYGTTSPGHACFPFANTTQASFTTTGYSSLTVSATNNSPRGSYAIVSLYSNNSNASEGWWQKPDQIIIDPPYPNPSLYYPRSLTDSQSRVQPATSFSGKTILGGIIL